MNRNKDACVRRLSRIEGQVRGIARMINEERYCREILTQMQAVKAALKKVEGELLKSHADTCLDRVQQTGSPAERRKIIDELIEMVGRLKS